MANSIVLRTHRHRAKSIHIVDLPSANAWNTLTYDPNATDPKTRTNSASIKMGNYSNGNPFPFTELYSLRVVSNGIQSPNFVGFAGGDFFPAANSSGTSYQSTVESNAATNAHLTYDNVMRSSFGVIVQLRTTFYNSDGSVNSRVLSDELHYTNLQFNIPRESDIYRIVVKATAFHNLVYEGPGLLGVYPRITDLEVNLRYNLENDAQQVGSDYDTGYVRFNEQPFESVSLDKTYQYIVSDKGKFLAEWGTDVDGEPTLSNSVNTLPGDLTVKLMRDLESGQNLMEELEITGYADGDLLLTSTQETILGSISVARSVGTGSDVDVNLDVEVKEYYGGLESLLTEDGEELLTEDLETLQVETGYPFGRTMYSGFISKYQVGYTYKGESTNIKILPHTDEHNNIMLESADTMSHNYIVGTTEAEGGSLWSIRAPDQIVNNTSATTKIAQTFANASANDLASVSMLLFRYGNAIDDESLYPRATIEIYNKPPDDVSKTLIASSTVIVSNLEAKEVFFPFNGVTIPANALSYSIVLSTDKVLGVAMSPNNIYSTHYGYEFVQSKMSQTVNAGTWSSQGSIDYQFRLWRRGGSTTLSMNSQDPATMLKSIVDFGKTRGSRVSYTDDSIVNTNTVVSARFNTNKLTEAEQAVLRYAPSDWYLYYDPATSVVNLKPRPEVVKHWFTLGKDIEDLYIEKHIEDLVNEIYFTGATTTVNSVSTTLYKRFVDGTSQANYRRGLEKIADGRVSDATTATIMAQAEINRRKDPIYAGKLTVIRRAYEDIVHPGDLIGFIGFNNFIESTRLQAVMVKTTSDRFEITLGLMLPPVSKRVEDIRRNLNEIEIRNNPTTPS